MKTIKLKPNEFLTIEVDNESNGRGGRIKMWEFVVNSDHELREINRTDKMNKGAIAYYKKMQGKV